MTGSRTAHSRSQEDGMRSPARLEFGLIFWVLVGAIICALCLELGTYRFQRYVATFHADKSWQSWLMHSMADLAINLRLLAWAMPMFSSYYYCRKHALAFDYIFWGGSLGGILGYMSSGYINANPGPNFHESVFKVPIGVCLGCLIGVAVQGQRNDWLANDPPKPKSR